MDRGRHDAQVISRRGPHGDRLARQGAPILVGHSRILGRNLNLLLNSLSKTNTFKLIWDAERLPRCGLTRSVCKSQSESESEIDESGHVPPLKVKLLVIKHVAASYPNKVVQ